MMGWGVMLFMVEGASGGGSRSRRRRGGRKKDTKPRMMVPNVFWRSITMDDLRQHPNFEALPELSQEWMAVPSDPKELKRLRQDSIQWNLAHRNRLTTRLVPAMLGFYEPSSAIILDLPRSLRSHDKAINAFHSLSQFSANELKTEDVSLEVDSSIVDREMWTEGSPLSKFVCEFVPKLKGTEEDGDGDGNRHGMKLPVADMSSVHRLRMKWGHTQEPISILSAVNYFTKLGGMVSEVGLCALEAHTDDLAVVYPTAAESSSYLPLIGASPDAMLQWENGVQEVIEVKNHSPFFFDRVKNKIIVRRHGPFHEVGAWYVAQLMWHILCAGPHCQSAILISTGISGVVMQRIKRDDELISLMVEFCGKFCKDYVASQVLPPVDFFLQEPMYGELLERTRKAAKSAERVVEIYEDDVQRNSIHADFFV